MMEVVVISGKGGTGKTSLTAAWAGLCDRSVIVDCDVDAANLHLLLSPSVRETHEFYGGATATIDAHLCMNCGICEAECRFGAVLWPGHNGDSTYSVDPIACEGCGVCAHLCPEKAIHLEEELCGQWFRSKTRFGDYIHANLFPGRENSGRLVSLIRGEARKTAKETAAETILIDGPPGIGCPVIASLTGADYAVIVTEPTLSGLEDMKRVEQLARHFTIPTGIVINKADLNASVAGRIKDYAAENASDLLGDILYDASFTQAQMKGHTILEYSSEEAAEATKRIWKNVNNAFSRSQSPLKVVT